MHIPDSVRTERARLWLLSAGLILQIVVLSSCGRNTDNDRIVGERTTDCVASPHGSAERGILTVNTSEYPCILHIEASGVTLTADPDNKWPDPGVPLAMAEDGGFFSIGAGMDPVVVKWSPDGRFIKASGRRGDGPGEFGSWFVQLFRGPNGLLYVRGSGRWLFLDQQLNLVRQIRSNFPGDFSSTAILEDGRILSSDQRAGQKDKRFHLFDPESETTVSFGDSIDAVEDSLRIAGGVRPIAYAGNDEFWVAPMRGSGAGYTLERWSVNGERQLVLKREVAWYPVGSDIATEIAPAARTAKSPLVEGNRQTRAALRPPSFVRSIYVDGTGLLYVYLEVVTERWTDIADPAERTDAYARMVDTYVEVIDPNAGIVLASTGPLSMAPSSIPEHFPLTRFGYSSAADSVGLHTVSLLRFRLAPR